MAKLTIDGMKLVYQRMGEDGVATVNRHLQKWHGQQIAIPVQPELSYDAMITEWIYPIFNRITLKRGVHYQEITNGDTGTDACRAC